jgi:2-polyprenyl-6-methoxyphenol hydroxylase-like FAD-dependent oxidoreductase
MSAPQVQSRRSVLISGASIAGPTLAYWLDRYGFDVTVVERADTVRSGGYPIDIRGVGMDVIAQMGLTAEVRAAHIHSRTISFVDRDGAPIATIPMYDMVVNEADDVELPRGVLTGLLYRLTKDSKVRYRFNERIETLEDDGDGVDVRFRSGDRQRYDVVIGADGLHSNTRRLLFGPEEQFNHYLGQTFNLFTVPNFLGLSHGAMFYAEPGRAAGGFVLKDSDRMFVMLNFATEKPPFVGQGDRDEQIERTAAVFAEGGWEVPRLVDELRRAEDLYFDTVSQIRLPRWSKGRVALVGDSAFAPSFQSGQGTSIALVGSYILAGELAAHKDPAKAFEAYERIARPFVEANQALAIKAKGASPLLPRTQEELDMRNKMLASFKPGQRDERQLHARAVHNSLTLPDYQVAQAPSA